MQEYGIGLTETYNGESLVIKVNDSSSHSVVTYADVYTENISIVDKRLSPHLSYRNLDKNHSVVADFTYPEAWWTYAMSTPSTNLTLSCASPTSIRSGWTDQSYGNLGFSLERKREDSSAWSEVAVVGRDTTAYTDSYTDGAYGYRYRNRYLRPDIETASNGLIHWLVAALDTVYTEKAIRGKVDNAVFTVAPINDDFTVTQNLKTGGDGAKLNGWKVINTVYADAIDINTTVAGELTVDLSNGNSQLSGANFTGPFVYKEIAGDFDVDTFITSHNGDASLERVWLVARDTSASVGEDWCGINRNYTSTATVRNVANSVNNDDTYTSTDMYLRITRVGNVITEYSKATAGASWTQRGQCTRNDFGATIQVGVAVVSHNTSNTFVARFGYFNTRQTNNSIVVYGDKGGGKIQYVRGVFLNTLDFLWDGFWAESKTAATNYYSSHVNDSTSTVITLSAPLTHDTSAQLYYYYSRQTPVDPYTYIDSYPCLFECNAGPFPFADTSSPYQNKFTAYVDAEQYFVVACKEAYEYTQDIDWNTIATTIIGELRKYDTGVGVTASTIDTFNALLSDRSIDGLYSTVGVNDTISVFDVADSPLDKNERVLKVSTIVSNGGSTVWGRTTPYELQYSDGNFTFDFLGQNDQKRYLLTLCNDINQTQNIDTLFKYGYADDSGEFATHTIPKNKAYKLKNIAYSGNVQPTTWSTFADTSAIVTATEAYKTWVEGTDRHYFGTDISWTLGGGAYAGAEITVPSGVISTGSTNINMYAYADTSATVDIFVDDNGNECWYSTYQFPYAGLHRVSIPWGSFAVYPYYQPPGSDLNSVFNHPAKQVRVQVSSPTGTISISEVKFGDYQTLQDSTHASFYQFDFPSNGAYTGYWDNVGYDITYPTAYTNVPSAIYQWNHLGKMSWRAPIHSGGVVPSAYYKTGYTSEALEMTGFMKDAQTEYANRYSVQSGPFMPVYLKGYQENREYGDLETWTWNGPDTNTNWAGFQYRALAQVAHYYYLTGSTNAKGILDSWMSWLSTRILDDAGYPSEPKGYKVPSDFVKDTGTYQYNYFSPDFHALIIQAMIFKYWRDGDSIAFAWYRRLLDDLTTNRKAVNGSYPDGSYTYGVHQGEVGKALGMLINGRSGATPNHLLSPQGSDVIAFIELYDYFINSRGTVKPVALSENYLPLHTREVFTQGIEKVWIPDGATTSESISTCLYFAVDYAKYTKDFTWMMKLKKYLLEAVEML